MSDAVERRNGQLHNIPIELLRAPDQPSREVFQDIKALAATIKEHGLLEPIIVKKMQKANGYEIICGLRRFEGCKQAALKTVPAIVYDGDLTPEQALELSLVENLQRDDLQPFEEIRLIHRIKSQFELTNAELGAKLGVSPSLVGTYLAIAEGLPANVTKEIVRVRGNEHPKTLSVSKAAILARAKLPPDKLKQLLRLIRTTGLTRDNLAKRLAGAHKKKIRRVAQARVFWAELTKSLREYARYWNDLSTLKEWETVSEYHLTLDVALPKDIGESKE